MEAFLNEADVLKVLSTQSCPYVVHLVGLQLEHAPPMIAMELVPCGNLLDILRSSAMTVRWHVVFFLWYVDKFIHFLHALCFCAG